MAYLEFDRMAHLLRKRKLQRLSRLRHTMSRIPREVLLARLALASLIALVSGMVVLTLLFFWFAKDLPRPGKVHRSEGFSTVILDRNGEKLYDVFEDENRIPLKDIADAPQDLRDATVAIEDKDFYRHSGISGTGIARSVINIFFFRRLQGGSTLTQQLVKNVLLSQERTLPRKIKEAILAVQIERKYSKDEILQMYLSETPYGGPTVGVVAASDYYFGKDVSELTLPEAAFLAGIAQSPTSYSPYTSDSKAYIWRTEQVLRRMREDNYITDEEEKTANETIASMVFSSGNVSGIRAPHFVMYIRELVEEQFGTEMLRKGLTVTTTLDWKLQEAAQSIVKEEVEKVKRLKVGNGAAVVLDPKTGEILSMVGSKEYSASEGAGLQFNVVTQGLRQPGSALKPITYAVAFASGYTPATLLMDTETKYPSGKPEEKEYNPKNYDNKYRGPVQLRYALANSVNTVAVKLSALVGTKEVLEQAYDMGLTTLEPTKENLARIGLSMTLGGGEVRLLELADAYGVFANGGNRVEPVAIRKVEDVNGKVLFEFKDSKPKRVMDEDIAYLITDILSDNDARKEVFGTNSQLVIPGKTVAVKTGTTDDKRDNWTVGYTPTRVVGVWVGNNDNSEMDPSLASGLTGAAPIWNRLMREALIGVPDEAFARPSSIMEMEIDAYGGGTPVPDRPTRRERFIKGSEPDGPAEIYQKIKVSRHDSQKLANQIEVAKGEYDEKQFVVFAEKDPVSTDGKNRWQEGIDAWIATQTDDKLKPPKDTWNGETDKLVVRFKKPGNNQKIDSESVEVRVESTSLEGIREIELFVNGNSRSKVNSGSFDTTLKLNPGSYELKVKARDQKDNTAEDTIRIGVKQDFTPSPTAAPTSVPPPTAAPNPTNTPSPTP